MNSLSYIDPLGLSNMQQSWKEEYNLKLVHNSVVMSRTVWTGKKRFYKSFKRQVGPNSLIDDTKSPLKMGFSNESKNKNFISERFLLRKKSIRRAIGV